jgi:Protein of unknown function (DUF3551)
MKHLSIFGAAAIAATLLIGSGPEANAAQWCAVDNEGGSNCGFYTYRQCQEDISGIGGSCERNYSYAPVRHHHRH